MIHNNAYGASGTSAEQCNAIHHVSVSGHLILLVKEIVLDHVKRCYNNETYGC